MPVSTRKAFNSFLTHRSLFLIEFFVFLRFINLYARHYFARSALGHPTHADPARWPGYLHSAPSALRTTLIQTLLQINQLTDFSHQILASSLTFATIRLDLNNPPTAVGGISKAVFNRFP